MGTYLAMVMHFEHDVLTKCIDVDYGEITDLDFISIASKMFDLSRYGCSIDTLSMYHDGPNPPFIATTVVVDGSYKCVLKVEYSHETTVRKRVVRNPRQFSIRLMEMAHDLACSFLHKYSSSECLLIHQALVDIFINKLDFNVNIGEKSCTVPVDDASSIYYFKIGYESNLNKKSKQQLDKYFTKLAKKDKQLALNDTISKFLSKLFISFSSQ